MRVPYGTLTDRCAVAALRRRCARRSTRPPGLPRRSTLRCTRLRPSTRSSSRRRGVQGSTVFSRRSSTRSRRLTSATRLVRGLQQLRHELSQQYVERGYVTSGVVIPEQRVTDGVVVLRAVEGELGGHRRSKATAVCAAPDRAPRRALRRTTAQRRGPAGGLTTCSNGPADRARERRARTRRARSAKAISRSASPSGRPLELARDRGQRSLGLARRGPRERSALTYRGLVGNGDVLSGRFGVSDGADDIALYYDVPLTPRGTKLAIALSDQDADIVEEPFDIIDIESRIETWSVTADRPFARRRRAFACRPARLRAQAQREHAARQSVLVLAGRRRRPRRKASAIIVGAEWSKRGETRRWPPRATLQVGVDVLDPTRNALAPDGDFTLFIGQLQYAQRIAWRDSRVLVRGLCNSPTMRCSRCTSCPSAAVTRCAAIARASSSAINGFVASAEYRFPCFRRRYGPTPRPARRRAVRGLRLVGSTSSSRCSAPAREHLSSAGHRVALAAAAGVPLRDLSRRAAQEVERRRRESLQDRGIHYYLSYRRAF